MQSMMRSDRAMRRAWPIIWETPPKKWNVARLLHRPTIYSMIQGSCFGEKEKRDTNRKYSGQGASESKENKSVELQPAFDMESSEVHYICAVRSYQETTAANHAAHMSVMELKIQFWRFGASLGSCSVTPSTGATGQLSQNNRGGPTRWTKFRVFLQISGFTVSQVTV